MNRQFLIVAAAGGSFALLLGAWGFQYIGGLAPCTLCLWQRWPHIVAASLGIAALGSAGPALPLLGMIAALTTAAIGGFHVGVEQGWWQGPTACSGAGSDLSAMSGADLLSTELPGSVVMCDEVAWQMLGISMAGWNMLASLAFAALWLMAARRAPTA